MNPTLSAEYLFRVSRFDIPAALDKPVRKWQHRRLSEQFREYGHAPSFSMVTAQALYSAVRVIGSKAGLVSQLAQASRK